MSKAPKKVEMVLDNPEAKGTVALVEGVYGPTLIVNGVEWGYIDLYNASECGSGPLQLLIFDPKMDDEALVKVILDPDKVKVVVNAEAKELPDRDDDQAIHWEGDRIFGGIPEGSD